MKFATSIRLFGDLVSATDSDYTSFSSLCLICPHCKGSVYLVGEHKRSSTVRKLPSGKFTKVKESSVSPYFTHHTKDEIFLACESKDLVINEQFLAHRKTVARLQRARLFKASFWELFCSNQYLKSTTKALGSVELDKYVTDAEKNTHIAFYSSLLNERILIEMKEKNSSISKIQVEPLFRDKANSPLLRSIAAFTWNQSNRNGGFEHQYTFVVEALSFLYAPANKKIFNKCMTALVLALYSTHFFQATEAFPDAFATGRLDPKTKDLIIKDTQEFTNTFLRHHLVIDTTHGNHKIASLSMTLITALLSIDPTNYQNS